MHQSGLQNMLQATGVLHCLVATSGLLPSDASSDREQPGKPRRCADKKTVEKNTTI